MIFIIMSYTYTSRACTVGLFLEGARWDKKLQSLVDPKAKELFSPMPTIHMYVLLNFYNVYVCVNVMLELATEIDFSLDVY